MAFARSTSRLNTVLLRTRKATRCLESKTGAENAGRMVDASAADPDSLAKNLMGVTIHFR